MHADRPPSSSKSCARSMALRVEVTSQAEQDADAILEWLLSQHAGDTGLRRFSRLEEALPPLRTSPSVARLLLKTLLSLSRSGSCFTAASRTSTAYCSPLRRTWYMCSASATVADGISTNRTKPRPSESVRSNAATAGEPEFTNAASGDPRAGAFLPPHSSFR